MFRSMTGVFALVCVMGTSADACAQSSASQVKNFLSTRNWWLSNSTDANGIVMIFTEKNVGNGYYHGQYVAIQNGLNQWVLGFSWKPVTNGFKLKFTGQVRELTFKIGGFHKANETLWLEQNGSIAYWQSTRSWLVPRSVSVNYRR